MTGYGRAADVVGDCHVTVEVRSVNHRFLELKTRGAQVSGALEEAVGVQVRGRFERGSVTIGLTVQRDGGAAQLDRARARQVFAELASLAAELGVAAPSLADVLAQPGVVAQGSGVQVDDAAVLRLLGQALDEVAAMRAREGQALAKELSARLAMLAAARGELAQLAAQAAPQVAQRLAERVRKTLAQLGAEGALDDARLAQEVASIVDRGDVTEELVRLESHLAQACALVEGAGGVGRRLEFLLQEIGRELNTVGSKSWSAAISGKVVEAKSELEKLREQVQNVE